MSVNTAYESPGRKYELGAEVLAGDHRLLRQLLARFEQTHDCDARRDLMQLVVDLFEVHSTLESLQPQAPELDCERDAVYELMEQVESADARSPIHYARGIELKRVFEAYIEREEAIAATRSEVLHLERTRVNRTLLRERADLVGYAMILLRLH